MRVTELTSAGFCRLGQRLNQEDSRWPDADAPATGQCFFAVCDGVGGQDFGELASGTVAGTIGSRLAKRSLGDAFSESDFTGLLDAVYKALSCAGKEGKGSMATTLAFVCFHSSGVFCAHIGDSRIYHIRPGEGILFRSEDHSLVNALVRSGNLTPEEAAVHPKRNVITRCLTPSGNRVKADTVNIADVKPGDRFLLCSDGVSGTVVDGTLVRVLSGGASAEDCARQLAVLSEGSADNNTAFVIDVLAVAEGKSPSFVESLSSRLRRLVGSKRSAN